MKKRHITIVIPAYNEAKYIGNVLGALEKQTYKMFDILVVDNNSKDNTGIIAKKFGANVLLQTEQGYVFALKKGVDAAKGEIIAVTDSDTTPHPYWLEMINNVFEDEKIVAVTGSVHYKDAGFLGNLLTYPLYTAFLYFNFLLNKPHLTGTSLAFRKAPFQSLGGVDTTYKISADVEIGLRLRKKGRVVLIPALSVVASSRRWKEKKLKNTIQYVQAYFLTVWFNRPPQTDLKPIR